MVTAGISSQELESRVRVGVRSSGSETQSEIKIGDKDGYWVTWSEARLGTRQEQELSQSGTNALSSC